MPSDTLAANAVLFGRLLRRAGIAVEPGQTRLFLRALVLLGLNRKADIKTAGRTVYVHRCEDRATYDAAFELFWQRRGDDAGFARQLPRLRQRDQDRTTPSPSEVLPNREQVDVEVPAAVPEASERERLRHADFADLTPDEERDARRMLDALRPRLPLRPARRRRLSGHGQRLAVRRMLRRALAMGGEALYWRWLERRRRPRPIVLVCDISGSMERYSRFLLRFAHALERTGAPLEVFVFSTRLTRITRELRVRSADEALRRVADRVVDWNGGTRIGESLHTLNRQWVRRTVRSGAVVLLVSDGWERGDPALLAGEMATLRRSCHRLLWLDPLASRPGFEPRTVGLHTALPYVDALVPCGTVASLEELVGRLVKGERRSKR